MTSKITRNDEEQAAFEALAAACLGNAPETFTESARLMAEGIEHFLLAQGYVIVAIPPINPVVMIPKMPIHRIDGAGKAYCGTTPTPLVQFMTIDDEKITCPSCISHMEHDARS